MVRRERWAAYLARLARKTRWTKGDPWPQRCHWDPACLMVFVTSTTSFWRVSYLINEIGCLETPAVRDLIAFYVNLSCKNLLPDLPTRLPNVGSPTVHAFVGNNSDCEVICRHSMVLSAHHLRSHVSRCSWGLRRVVRAPVASDTEICQSKISVTFENHVLRLDISVDYAATMYRLQGLDETSNKKLCLFLRESSLSCNMISQVTAK